MTKQQPDALMSYTRFDDKQNGAYLTTFRERLSGEVHAHTGQPFHIFQDIEDIKWGQQFEQRIDQALATITFFIPILTPSFFKSGFCRYELEKFLAREQRMGRRDLVLPVYYIRVPALEDESLRVNDPLLQTIAARQYIDWRELRFEGFDAPNVRRMLAKMAEQIADALERPVTLPPSLNLPDPTTPVRSDIQAAKPSILVEPAVRDESPLPSSLNLPKRNQEQLLETPSTQGDSQSSTLEQSEEAKPGVKPPKNEQSFVGSITHAQQPKLNRKYLTRLSELLTAHFDDEELHTLCFDLGVDYDDLGGKGKTGKVRELVALLERHQRIADLVALAKKLRPNVDWEILGETHSDLLAPEPTPPLNASPHSDQSIPVGTNAPPPEPSRVVEPHPNKPSVPNPPPKPVRHPHRNRTVQLILVGILMLIAVTIFAIRKGTFRSMAVVPTTPTATSTTDLLLTATTVPMLTTTTPPPSPTPELGIVSVPIGTTGQEIEMIEIPVGPFLMGSHDGDPVAAADEKPQHTLTLETYWIGKTEVTNAQFRPFVEGDGYTNRDYWTDAGWEWRVEGNIVQPGYWTGMEWNGDEQPVIGVSWYEAMAYTNWLSEQTGHDFRLPTEAEWEKAARGPDGRIWPWGNEWMEGRANSNEAGIGKTMPVGSFPAGASPYGVLDMAGNAWEWAATKWQVYPYTPEDEWSEDYLAADTPRVIRGCSFWCSQQNVRGAYRDRYNPRNRNTINGVRLASASLPPDNTE